MSLLRRAQLSGGSESRPAAGQTRRSPGSVVAVGDGVRRQSARLTADTCAPAADERQSLGVIRSPVWGTPISLIRSGRVPGRRHWQAGG
jgi:hypothetical protein